MVHAPFKLRLRTGELRHFKRPLIMGVINVSADSFYNPALSQEEALRQAAAMCLAGADCLDIGGEATNPHVSLTDKVHSPRKERDLVVPVIEAIKTRFDVLVSVDTSDALVMRDSINVGADIINDQRALSKEGALDVVIKHQMPCVLMHNFEPFREPGSTKSAVLLSDMITSFKQLTAAYMQAGLAADRIILDPGFGQGCYGKSTEENFYLLKHLSSFTDLGFPVLAGWSRKSMISDVLGGCAASDRLIGSISALMLCLERGVAIMRVHDVQESVEALKMFMALR